LIESLTLDTTVTATKITNVFLTESLPLQATVATEKAASVSLTESLPLADTVTTTHAANTYPIETIPLQATVTTTKAATASLAETLPLQAAATATKITNVFVAESLPLQATVTTTHAANTFPTETLPLQATVATEKAASTSLTESLPLQATVTTLRSASVSLTEFLQLQATTTTTKTSGVSLAETLQLQATATQNAGLTRSATNLLVTSSDAVALKNKTPQQELIGNTQHTTIIDHSNVELVILSSSAALENIIVDAFQPTNLSINYTTIKSGNAVTISNGPTVTIDVDSSRPSFDVEVSFADSTTVTGPAGWNGLLLLPTFSAVSIPPTTSTSGGTTTTTTYGEITPIEIGLSSQQMTLDKPVRIKFIGDGGSQGFTAFFKRPTDTNVVFITTQCTADDLATVTAQLGGTGECVYDNGSDLIVWTTHFTIFGTTKATSSSTGSPSSPGTSGPSGGGGGGGGGGATGGAAKGGFGGRLEAPITIYEISYDVCEQNMVRIIVGASGSDAPPPNVKIRTPLSEVYSATLAKDQPYVEQNKALQISRYVYEAPLDRKLNFFIVTVEQTEGRTAASTTYLVNMDECRNTIIVNPMSEIDKTGALEPTIAEGNPNIFAVRFQINENKPVDATTPNQFVEPDDQFKVTAIVDSPTAIRRAELRVNVAGGNFSNYAAVKMDVAPLQNITNAYVVSASLPQSFMKSPAMVYWIHVINNEGKVQSSERHVIGVKPSYEIDAKMELDSPPSKAQGTTYRPTAYVYNEKNTLLGTVSLIVDGKTVYTSPPQLLKGNSVVNLEWDIPEDGIDKDYSVYAQLNLYDKVIKTSQVQLKTFKETMTSPISEPINVSSVIDEGQIVARVGLLYSSDDNPALHYRVVAPDGTCVIGQSESCLVKDSTAKNRGNTISVEIDGQVYRVRYSGQDSPLERFSITSVDPIEGTWNVSLESDSGIIPEAHAIENVHLKMKYRPTYLKLVTVSSEQNQTPLLGK